MKTVVELKKISRDAVPKALELGERYRLLNEPRRMWKRYLGSNFTFLKMLTKAAIFGKGRYDCD